MSGLINKLFDFCKEINPATLTGSIDVVIIQQDDGTYHCSPFHVRFGKIGVLRAREKVVDITINGKPVDLHMKLGEAGEAFFVREVEGPAEEFPPYLATSPIPSGAELMKQHLQSESRSISDENSTGDGRTLSEISGGHVLSCIISGRESSPEGGTSESEGHGHTKKRKKRKNMRRKTVSKAVDGKKHNEEDIFEMEDVSTDEDCNLIRNPSLNSITVEDKMNRTDDWASKQYQYFHPMSDTEVLPHDLQDDNIKDVKSDTEVDKSHKTSLTSDMIEDQPTWEWGDLPKLTEATTVTSSSSPVTTSRKPGESEAGGIFGFISSKPKTTAPNKPQQEGIYLEEINKLDDPEIAKYFPKSHFESIKDKEEDNESGRGASLPQSPHSVEGAIGGPSVNFLESEVRHLGEVSLSLCGGLGDSEGVTLEKFMQKVLTFDDLSETPTIVNNPDLVVKIHDNFYNWQTAAPIVLSMVSFQKNLPQPVVDNLVKDNMPKKVDKKKSGGGMSSWFKWGRGSQQDSQQTIPPPPPPPPPPITGNPTSTTSATTTATTTTTTTITITTTSTTTTSTTASPAVTVTGGAITNPTSTATSGGSLPSQPQILLTSSSLPEVSHMMEDIMVPKPKEDHIIDVYGVTSEPLIYSDAETDISERECAQSGTASNSSEPQASRETKKDRFKKSLRLTSVEIHKLGLNEGRNEVTFSVTTQYQGTCRCTSHIYLWKTNEKIVISDIDGTITKSDVLGHILPIIGQDWSQSGVAQLFTRIYDNSYKFVYLSARAIGQSRITKDLLKNIKQGDLVLPDGPLLLNPTSLIRALHREVVNKNPEEFKISCLKDIAALFPSNPFYAGFGNKITDVYAYKALNIPDSRIFTINHRGELRHELIRTFHSSYSRLSDIADHFFPPLHQTDKGSQVHKDQQVAIEYSSPIYWREPIVSLSETEINKFKDMTKQKTKDSVKQKR